MNSAQINQIYSYKLKLSYKGTLYSGWQFQTKNQNTVQNTLNTILKKVLNSNNVKTIATSRTDTGVHAHGQIIKLETDIDFCEKKLLSILNFNLPNDIKVISLEKVDNKFNVNKSIVSKEYNYILCNRYNSNAMINDISLTIDYEIDIEKMNYICSIFEGTHNFTSFCVNGGRNSNKLRTIKTCCIYKKDTSPLANEVYVIKFVSSGFLKYMVRRIVSALLNVYHQKLDINEVKSALKDGTELSIVEKALAQGLHLIEINYES